MHESVKPGLEEYEAAGELVEVDVVVKWKNAGQAHVAEEGDGVAQDQAQDEDRVEQ